MQYVLYADNSVAGTIEDIGLDDDMYCYAGYGLSQWAHETRKAGLLNCNKINSDILKEALKFNCPNCGAPVKSHTCEYCGTVLDPIAMEKERNELSSLETRLKCLQIQVSQAEQSATLLTGFSNLFNKNRKGY